MNKEKLNEVFQEAIKLALKKNSDYAGTIDNIGLTGAHGCAVRLVDKVARVHNLTRPGQINQVEDEDVRQTFLDMVNYAAFGVMLLDGTWKDVDVITKTIYHPSSMGKTESILDKVKIESNDYHPINNPQGTIPYGQNFCWNCNILTITSYELQSDNKPICAECKKSHIEYEIKKEIIEFCENCKKETVNRYKTFSNDEPYCIICGKDKKEETLIDTGLLNEDGKKVFARDLTKPCLRCGLSTGNFHSLENIKNPLPICESCIEKL